MKIKPRTVVLFLIIVAATAGLIYGLSKLPIHVSYITFISGLVFTFAVYLLTPLREPFKALVHRIWFPNKPSRCNICIFGISGTGKSSLINSWMLTSPDQEMTSTENVKFYLGKSGKVPFRILDYRGQQPNQLAEELRKSLFKPNAAIFIVDILPFKDENDIPLVKPQTALRWLENDTEQKLQARAEEHRIFIIGGLPFIFPHLRGLTSVRLVINKYDIIEELLKQQHKTPQVYEETEKKIRELFKPVEEELKKACNHNKIADFEVAIISAYDDKNTRRLLFKITDRFNR